jgi:hypothetical protein
VRRTTTVRCVVGAGARGVGNGYEKPRFGSADEGALSASHQTFHHAFFSPTHSIVGSDACRPAGSTP